MPLSLVFQLMDDVEEFCYVLSHTLQLHEVLNYWTQEVAIVKARVSRKLKAIQDRSKFIPDASSSRHDPKRMDENKCYLFSTSALPCDLKFGKTHFHEENMDVQQRIDCLEEQVSQLRKAVESLNRQPFQLNSEFFELTRPVALEIPPPPPPPPPPLPKSCLKHSPFSWRKKKKPKVLSEHNAADTTIFKPDMAKLLRGIKDIKLRPTERSPGGTPMRRISSRDHEAHANDTVGLMNCALRKRFASIHPEDLSNKENTLEDSWENSPNLSFSS